MSGQPGDPFLPTHKLRLLLPPEADLGRVHVLVQNPVWEDIEDKLDLAPAPPIMRIEGEKKLPSWGEKSSDWIENGRDTRIYHQDDFFPSQIASVIGNGKFRQWKIVEVQIYRMRYNPLQRRSQVLRGGTLVVETHVEELSVATAPSTIAAPSQVSIDRLHRLIINDADIGDFYPSTATVAAGSETAGTLRRLAIITTRALMRANLELVNYINFKQSRGYTVYVVTEGDALDVTHYRRGYDTFSRARNIRNWLTTYHAQIDSVLLIGNPDPVQWSDSFGVPMMFAHPDNGFSPPNPAGLPTDMYYAELSGNWDLDGDGFPGEFIGDFGPGGIDQFCELEVGRIPYYFIHSELARTDVYPRITYTYAVTGANGFGESDFSETDTGFLEDCPGDFDFDGDIDGGDLELYIDSGGIDVGAFSGHYGRIDCH
ncbi:MAG: C25 family cysteine peptidase [Nitrospinales bacterium]